MNIITISELRSIRAGIKKAERDFLIIEALENSHDARHAATPGWNCIKAGRELIESLGNDIENAFEAAGYDKVAKAKSDAAIKQRAKQPKTEQENDGFQIIPVETNGDETQEEIMALVERAMRTQMTLNQMVSETSDEKGGK